MEEEFFDWGVTKFMERFDFALGVGKMSIDQVLQDLAIAVLALCMVLGEGFIPLDPSSGRCVGEIWFRGEEVEDAVECE